MQKNIASYIFLIYMSADSFSDYPGYPRISVKLWIYIMSFKPNNLTVVPFLTTLIVLLVIRLLVVLPSANSGQKMGPDLHPNDSIQDSISSRKKNSKVSLMVLLGSGGHTGEMARLLSQLNLKQYQLTWIVSEGDSTSLLKVRDVERKQNIEKVNYIVLARARKVGESFVLSVFSTFRSLKTTTTELFKTALPDILVINGPGTCVPVAYVLFFLKFIGVGYTKIIYIESLARVKGLSLGGKLVLPITDRFIVQWRSLAEKYRRAEYYGILI